MIKLLKKACKKTYLFIHAYMEKDALGLKGACVNLSQRIILSYFFCFFCVQLAAMFLSLCHNTAPAAALCSGDHLPSLATRLSIEK